jgi:SagB-type dehydrogenase family enzyme
MDESDYRTAIERGRRLLRAEWDLLEGMESDQSRGVKAPELQKPIPPGGKPIPLSPPDRLGQGRMPLVEAVAGRRSRREFAADPVSEEELSFLLWATQGVKSRTAVYSMRTVPSGGARHALETYLFLARMNGIGPGFYRYLPFDHALLLLRAGAEDLASRVDEALFGQYYNAALVFIWTAIPYRMEWRYTLVSHKIIALDAGHVCENLYLACESIGCGTCAIGAYDQKKMDALLEIDGRDEFAVYAAPVGKRSS